MQGLGGGRGLVGLDDGLRGLGGLSAPRLGLLDAVKRGGDWSGSVALNPAATNSGIELSHGNLRATRIGSAGWVSSRATVGRDSGKFYYELTFLTSATASGGGGIAGLGKLGMDLAYYVGGDSLGVGAIAISGNVSRNGVSEASIPTAVAAGDIYAVAIDVDIRRAYFRKIGDPVWNGNPLADPAKAIGGISLSAGPWFPAISVYAVGDAVQLNTGQSPPAGTIPTGFGAWK